MRINLPITDIEYILKELETVVSKADLNGNITYVNQDFINISGFSEEELIGAPQNIVRHPDMPGIVTSVIVTTIRGMARNLGLKAIAEGVEQAAQAEALLALGCDEALGYYFGHPEPAHVFAQKWLPSDRIDS